MRETCREWERHVGRVKEGYEVEMEWILLIFIIGCVNVVCSDKTGTLTQHIMEATQIYIGQYNYNRTCYVCTVYIQGEYYK